MNIPFKYLLLSFLLSFSIAGLSCDDESYNHSMEVDKLLDEVIEDLETEVDKNDVINNLEGIRDSLEKASEEAKEENKKQDVEDASYDHTLATRTVVDLANTAHEQACFVISGYIYDDAYFICLQSSYFEQVKW